MKDGVVSKSSGDYGAAVRCRGVTAALVGAGLALLAGTDAIAQETNISAPRAPQCSQSVNGLNFVCGVVNPEDIVLVPGTRWLIASGYDPGGGLPAGAGIALVDTQAKRSTVLYNAGQNQIGADKLRFPSCVQAPPANFVTHGLYLRATAQPRHFLLYAVTHAPRETVEVFSLDASGDIPKSAWLGCQSLPDGLKGNGVAAFSDGTMLVTVLNAPPYAAAEGSARGIVLQWKPGNSGFQPVAGTDLSSDNGIEISKDEKEIFVIGFGDATVYVFSREKPGAPLRSAKAPGFVPDNLRWSADQLIATGPMYDEPACGGTRREAAQMLGAVGRKPGGGCNRGYMVAALDPIKMTWKVLAYAEPNPQIGIISAGVIVGDTLWIGAALSPGLAYRTLPRPTIQQSP